MAAILSRPQCVKSQNHELGCYNDGSALQLPGQGYWQHCCWGTCQIWLKNSKPKSCSFETSQDLVVRRPSSQWIEALDHISDGWVLVKIMPWCRLGNKPLIQPLLIYLSEEYMSQEQLPNHGRERHIFVSKLGHHCHMFSFMLFPEPVLAYYKLNH